MRRVNANGNGTRNRILQTLSAPEFDRIRRAGEEVSLDFKEPVYDRGKPIEYMHFVESGVVSLVTDLEHGMTLETGTVGPESVVGIPAFLGSSIAAGRAFCQIPGWAIRVNVETVLAERERQSQLATVILRVANATMSMMAQTAACNGAHPVAERMAKWLLMTHDRVDGDEFPLTQEFLAMMLGVRRPSVNTAGLMLQQAGVIRYSRGRITILNREGLEASSCECYKAIADAFENAINPPSVR
jgi:CRP-like cAMP-binding protein